MDDKEYGRQSDGTNNGQRSVGEDHLFEFQSFEYEKKQDFYDVSVPQSTQNTYKPENQQSGGRRRRGRDKRNGMDFSSFGAPMKAQTRPQQEFEVSAPVAYTHDEVTENVASFASTPAEEENELRGQTDDVQSRYAAEPEDFVPEQYSGEGMSESEAPVQDEGPITEYGAYNEEVPEVRYAVEPEDRVTEQYSEEVSESEAPVQDEVPISVQDAEPEQYPEHDPDVVSKQPEFNDDDGVQISLFDGEDYGTRSDASARFVDRYGIQEKFDITFLDPVTETENESSADPDSTPERETETESDSVIPGDLNGVADGIPSYAQGTDDPENDAGQSDKVGMYNDEGEYTLHTQMTGTLEPEDISEPVDDTAENDADIEDNTEIVSEDVQTTPDVIGTVDPNIVQTSAETESLKPEEACEIPATEEVDTGHSADIWDDTDRSEWTERERFLEHCRGLTLPPLKTTKAEKAQKKRGRPSQNMSSGYSYETVERLPFDEGTRIIDDREAYRKREKVFCEERSKERGKKLRSKLNRSLFKTWAVAAVAFIILAIDCLGLLKAGGEPFINEGNLSVICTAEIVILLIGAILTADIIRDGIRCAVKGMYIPETLTAMITVLTLFYHVFLLLYRIFPEVPVILGSPAAISMLLASVYRYYMLRREVKVFELTSSYRPYTTEVRMKDFRTTPECMEFEGYAPHDAVLYKLNRIYRIDGLYDELPVRDTCFGVIRLLILCTVCASAAAGIVFGIINRSVADGIFSAYVMMALASPLSVFVSMYMPRIKAAESAASEGVAVIRSDEEGDSFEENVIMLDDSELFRADTLSPKIEVCNTPELEHHLMRTASLFRHLGGTLGYLFNDPGFEEHKNISVREIAEHGIYATVDGSDVIAGSEKYLKEYGIKVNRYDGELLPNARVLYIADGDEFFCRIIMSFKPDGELCRRISELRNAGTLVSLKSCNPCIDEELVFMETGLEPDLLKLIKYVAGDDVCPAETDREGVLVSSSGAAGLFSALLEYKRQRRLVFIGSRFAAVACIAGAAAAFGVILSGTVSSVYAPLVAVGVHGVLSLIAGFIGSRKVIDTKTVIKKR